MTTRRLAGVMWAGLILLYYYRRALRLLLAGPAAWAMPGFIEGGWRLPWTWVGEAVWRAGEGLAGAGAVIAAAWVLGLLILRLLRCRPDNALDTFLFRLGAGFGGLSYLSFALAATGHYRPAVIAPIVVVLGATALCLALAHLARGWPGVPVRVRNEGARYGTIVGITLAIALVGALAPEKEYDALWYHLWLPKLWLQHGHPVDVVSEYVSLYPLTWELLYGDAMALGGVVAAKLLHFACLPLVAAATWQLTRRFFDGVSPWLAAALVVTAPTVLWEATTAYVDLALALYVTLGVYALLVHVQSGEAMSAGWFRLAALCFGLAATIKHLGLVVVALVAVGLLVHATFAPPKRRQALEAVLLVVVALVLASPWYWRAWSASGNPFFPELFALFGARPPERWDAITEAGLAGFKSQFGFGRSLRSILLLPWTVTQHAASFRGSIGPLFLLAAPCVLVFVPGTRLKTRAATLWLVYLFLGYVVVWACPVSSFQLRFLVPIVPVMAVLAAVGLTRFFRRSGWALVVLLALNLPPFTPLHEGDREHWNAWLSHVVRTIPMGVVTGRESADAYLRRDVPTYGAWQHLRDAPSNATVVFESGGGDNLYATQPKIPIDAPLARGGWAEGPGADATVRETLQRLHITHVLLDKDWLAKMASEGAALASPAFRDTHLVLEYEDPRALLYRVAPTRSDAMQRSFLPN